MVDRNTFLTTLYVMADDFCKQNMTFAPQPGPEASLEPGEVITLALFEQFWHFRSERAFYEYAQKHLKGYFPSLPARTQFNRLVRHHWETIVVFWQYLVDQMEVQKVTFEVLDTVPIPVRNIKRRGRGWLAGMANIGWSTRLGWYNGFHGLISVNPIGVITGYAFASASEKDQPMADTFLALRRYPQEDLPTAGRYTLAYYLADNGFKGRKNANHWNLDLAPCFWQLLCEGKQTFGPKHGAIGSKAYVRLLKPCMTNSKTGSPWARTVATSCLAFTSGLQQKSLYTIS